MPLWDLKVLGPNVYVSINTRWVVEKLVDKRHNEELRCYQYLAKYEGFKDVCNRWLTPGEVELDMVKKFESKREKQVAAKEHVAAWYPFGEQFVVQWKSHPFFIVPYGGQQINNFCVVALDKTGKHLKCKDTKHPNHPQHQVHVQLVQKEMTKLNLTIRNKTICLKDDGEDGGGEEEEEEVFSLYRVIGTSLWRILEST